MNRVHSASGFDSRRKAPFPWEPAAVRMAS
jgi:hypothetical protein